MRSPEPAGSTLALLSRPPEPWGGAVCLVPRLRDEAPPCTGLAPRPYPTLPPASVQAQPLGCNPQTRPSPPRIPSPLFPPGGALLPIGGPVPLLLSRSLRPAPCLPSPGETVSPPRGVHPWRGGQPLLSSQGFRFSWRLERVEPRRSPVGFRNRPTHQPSSGPLLLPWCWWFLLGPPPLWAKTPVRVPVASGHTCCGEPAVRNVLSPQIRAAEGLNLCCQRREGHLQILHRNRGPALF